MHERAQNAVEATQRWLLVTNCTAVGLANSLNLLCPAVTVEAVDYGTFQRKADEYRPRLDGFDLFLTPPHFVRNPVVDFREAGAVQVLPTPYFDAYHPDLCYLESDAGPVKGVVGDYHSKIVTAAFQAGLSRRDTVALFSGPHYARFGYLGRWDGERERLLSSYRSVGLELSARFVRWGDRGPFMHSVNHPSIAVLHDLGRALLAQQGLAAVESHVMPHDNLLNGPVWPVYGEIAETLGVPGSYQFKLGAQWRCIGLEAFVASSYALLEASGPVRCAKPQRASFEQVAAAL